MNLSEALDAALPEMPKTRTALGRPPMLDPELVVREDELDGEKIIAVLQREKGNFFRLQPMQWQLATYFDGVRSYEEIAEQFAAETGASVASDEVRQFADNMEEACFWFKTAQEKNLALSQKLRDQRSRRAGRTSKVNLAHMSFSAWDPDRYFDWLNGAAGNAIFSSWSVLAMVVLFLFETVVFIANWSQIGPDVPLYYNFTHKSLLDLAQFWLLFLFMGFLHESAHGLTCKHYGGQVHGMGLMFMYLMPAFYCDVTEAWVSASRAQRMATIIAGIWVEMVVCGIAMIVWTNTVAGQWIHDFSYQIILITGIAVVVVNLNPLIKLDGYYFFTEFIGIPDLKERSTSFVSGWFQSKILGLPVETPVVLRRRAPFFAIYAIISGAYSYALLFVVVRLAYNITSKWMAEFALIPAGALAFMVFRSRLRSLRGVIVRFWRQHFTSIRSLRPVHFVMIAVLAIILFAPFWRDRESAYFVIEPIRTETVHAAIAGRVAEVLVHQGETVRGGEPLIRMTSPMAASMHSLAVAQTGNARYQAITAELHGESIGGAAALQDASARSAGIAGEAQSSLVIAAPEDATVLTKNPAELLDQDVGSGQSLLDLADAGPRAVRVFIPISALDRIPPNAEVALALPGSFSIVRVTLAAPGGDAVNLPAGIVPNQDYKGIKLPVFYASRMTLPPSAGSPRIGISGEAKVFGTRRSLASRILIVALNLIKAHVW
jgi:putative peptide zinc metalloprotease protein